MNLTWRIHGKGKFDGWLYGPTIEGQFTGDNIAYIYQDLTTAILGTFDHGKLVAGKAATIKAYRYKFKGIWLKIIFHKNHAGKNLQINFIYFTTCLHQDWACFYSKYSILKHVGFNFPSVKINKINFISETSAKYHISKQLWCFICRCRDGILELKFSKPKADSAIFKFERLTETFITSQMTVMDPHDNRYV